MMRLWTRSLCWIGGRTLVCLAAVVFLGSMCGRAAVAAEVLVSRVTDFSNQPVGLLKPISAWFWTDAQKRNAAAYSRLEVVSDPLNSSRQFKVAIDPSLPWLNQGKPVESYRLYDTGLSYLLPQSDVLRLRVKVLSGRFTLRVSSSTVYFGNSDVFSRTRTVIPAAGDAWQDLDFSLNENLTRNYRRAGFSKKLPVIHFSRWIQETLAVDLMPGSSGTLLIQQIDLIGKGQGRAYPEFPAPQVVKLQTAADFETASEMAKVFTFTHAPTDTSGPPVLARPEWAPPRVSRVAEGASLGASLESRAVGYEEVAFTGIKTTGPAGANALAIRIRADHPKLFELISLDFLAYVAPPGSAATFPWSRFAPPPSWVGATGIAFDSYLSQDRTVGVSYGFYHVRRHVTNGAWQTLVIPLADFICAYGQEACAAWLSSQASLQADRVIALGFVSSFRQHMGETRIVVDDVSWVKVPLAEGEGRSFWQPPLAPQSVQMWSGEGGDDTWLEPGNWSPLGPPANDGSAQLLFPGSLWTTSILDQPWDIASLVFDPSADAYVLDGAELSLRAGGVINQSELEQTFRTPIRIASSQSWTAAAGGIGCAGPVTLPGTLWTLTGEFPFDISAVVGGTGAMLKAGEGDLRLSQANTFSGGFALEGGTLEIADDSAIGLGSFYPRSGVIRSAGTHTLSNGLVFEAGVAAAFSSPFPLRWTGEARFTGSQTLRVEDVGEITFAGPFLAMTTGATWSKVGSGVLTLAGALANQTTGTVSVLEGTLALDKTAGVNAIAAHLEVGGRGMEAAVLWRNSEQVANTSVITVRSGGRLDLNGKVETLAGLRLEGGMVDTEDGSLRLLGGISSFFFDRASVVAGSLDLAGLSQGVSVVKGSSDTDLLISARIANGGFLKGGSGTLVLTGSNTFAGGLNVGFGTVGIANDFAAGTGPILLGQGKLRADGGARTLTNILVAGCRACQPNDPSDPTFTGPNRFTLSGPVLLRGLPTWTFEGPGETSLTGQMYEDVAGRGMTKVGPGLLTLAGTAPNLFTGPTRVGSGVLALQKSDGIVAIRGNLDIGGDVGRRGDAVVSWRSNEQVHDSSQIRVWPTGILDLNGRVETANLVLGGGRVITSGGLFVLAGDMGTAEAASVGEIFGRLSLGGAARVFNIADSVEGDDVRLEAILSNGGLTKLGSGQLRLGAANEHTGGTQLEWGGLVLAHDQAAGRGPLVLRTSTTFIAAADGARRLTNEVQWGGSIGVRGEDDLEFAGTSRLMADLTAVVAGPGVASLSGPVVEASFGRRLFKRGLGPLRLSGSNQFAGGIWVEEGWLELASPAAPGRGLVTVSGGGLRLNRLATPIQVAGLTVQTNGRTELILGAPSDVALVNCSGALSLKGALNIVARPGFGPGVYRLIDCQGVVRDLSLTPGNLPSGYKYALASAGAGRINLVVTQAPPTGDPVSILDAQFGLQGMRFSFPSKAGVAYLIQFTESLGAGDWQLLQRVSGDGTIVEVVDPEIFVGKRFYRIITE